MLRFFSSRMLTSGPIVRLFPASIEEALVVLREVLLGGEPRIIRMLPRRAHTHQQIRGGRCPNNLVRAAVTWRRLSTLSCSNTRRRLTEPHGTTVIWSKVENHGAVPTR